MENNNSVRSALVLYIWMHHALKNIRQNSTFFDSKSATHEIFVIGKSTFRISHEFFMSLRGQISDTLSRYFFLICFLCHSIARGSKRTRSEILS